MDLVCEGADGVNTQEIPNSHFPHNSEKRVFLSNRQHLALFGCMGGARWVTALRLLQLLVHMYCK